jgi:hypothetical protein
LEEVMGLVEYPHLFSWVQKAATSDPNRTPPIVHGTLINEDQVETLMIQATSLPGIEPGMRLLVLLHMLAGTAMPRMTNMKPNQAPTLEQLELTGLPSVLCAAGGRHYSCTSTPYDLTIAH